MLPHFSILSSEWNKGNDNRNQEAGKPTYGSTTNATQIENPYYELSTNNTKLDSKANVKAQLKKKAM
jgi:hypothetical protein